MEAVVLLSGGLDSTLCLRKAIAEHGKNNVLALTMFYGQKHAAELDAAEKVAEFFGVQHRLEKLPPIFVGSGCALLGESKMPEGSYSELAKVEGTSSAYVPFRNANLLSAATTLALIEGARFVYYGAHSEDSHNWAYPDCTPEFNGAFANSIYAGTGYKVRLITPLQWMTKREVVVDSILSGSPVHLTYSCYNGTTPSCGVCPTCVSRIEAFKASGWKDLIEYSVPIDWKNCVRMGY